MFTVVQFLLLKQEVSALMEARSTTLAGKFTRSILPSLFFRIIEWITMSNSANSIGQHLDCDR